MLTRQKVPPKAEQCILLESVIYLGADNRNSRGFAGTSTYFDLAHISGYSVESGYVYQERQKGEIQVVSSRANTSIES